MLCLEIMSKAVLITGAAGFIGFHLSQRMLAEGHHVIAVDNFCTGSRSHREALLEQGTKVGKLLFIEADITHPWTWVEQIPTSWIEKLERVFHLASPASPAHYLKLSMETLAANSVGLQHALNFADSANARLVFASTSEVYGASDKGTQVEDQWGCVNSYGPRSCYQEAKRFGEALIYSHNARHKTMHGLVRIFNTYGPHMNPEDGRVVINFLTQAQKKHPLTVYGDGKQTRSFCYVSDLIEGLNRYSLKPLTVPINLGNPEEMTILNLAKVVAQLYPESDLQLVHHELPQEDPLQRCPDISRAFEMLDGWRPQVSLKQGLRQMSAWLNEAMKI